jgi:glycosyltransferase involved in cell wall biosynthesis
MLRVLIVGGYNNPRRNRMNREYGMTKEFVRDRKLDDIVEFVGSVPHENMPLYYTASDVCVVPSYYESFCMVALEAMSCGTPLVGSPVGGLPYLIDEGINGFLVSRGDSEELANRIMTILGNEKRGREMGKRGTLKTVNYRWSGIAGKIAELYSDLLLEFEEEGNKEDGTDTRCCCASR